MSADHLSWLALQSQRYYTELHLSPGLSTLTLKSQRQWG